MVSDYDMSIHHNPEAVAWAKFFMECYEKHKFAIDEATMVGWFANAMMAMYDFERNKALKAAWNFDIQRARELLEFAASELTVWADNHNPKATREKYPSLMRDWESDMETVNQINEFLKDDRQQKDSNDE